MRRWPALALLLASARARAEEPVTLHVQGSAATGFTSQAEESDKPRDVADTAALLEGTPGLRVRRLGGDGGFSTLSIRGAASNQVGVVLAGIPLVGAADPSLDLSTLPLFPGAIARVYRSFAPARLGGGHLGGLVAIEPLGALRARTEAYLAAGSFGAYRLRLADVHSSGAWTLGAGLSASRAENDFPFHAVATDADTTRKNAAHAQVGALVAARHRGDEWRTTLTLLANTRRDGVPGPFDAETLSPHLSRDRLLFGVHLRRQALSLSAWSRTEGRTVTDPRGELGLGPGGTTHDRVAAFGTSVGFVLGGAGQPTATFGFDPSIELSRGDHGDVDARYDRSRVGGALDLLWPFEALTLALSGRVDVRADRSAATSRREALPVVHVGIEVPAGLVTLAAHLGTLARPPSFLELLGDGGSYLPAPHLGRERAYTVDLGLRHRSEHLELEAVGFGSLVDGLIVFVAQGLATQRAENVGRALVIGGEVAFGVRAGPLRLSTTYTALLTRDRTDQAASAGAPLPGRPGHDLLVDLSFQRGPWSVRWGFDVVSETTLDRAGLRTLPARAFHSVGGRVALPGGLVLAAEIANLFDQRTVAVPFELGQPERRYPISDFQGYPIPGRRGLVSLRFSH